MSPRRNPLSHPMSAAQACRRGEERREKHIAVSDQQFKDAVDRGYRRFWLRRGVDVDSSRVNEI